MLSISKYNFIPEIQEAIQQFDQTGDGSDKLLHLLVNTEGSTVVSNTELNWVLELADKYNISSYDLLTGKIDFDILKDVLRFLNIREDINKQIMKLPYVDNDKINNNIKKSKIKKNNIINFEDIVKK